jgi:hypothetical protein
MPRYLALSVMLKFDPTKIQIYILRPKELQVFPNVCLFTLLPFFYSKCMFVYIITLLLFQMYVCLHYYPSSVPNVCLFTLLPFFCY